MPSPHSLDALLPAPLRALLVASPQLVAVFDAADELRWANPAFRAAMGMDLQEGGTWEQLMRHAHQRGRGSRVEAADFEAWLQGAKSRRGKQAYRTIEGDWADGRWFLMAETTSPEGWMLCVATEVTNLMRDERQLRVERDRAIVQAGSDELTGLQNRRQLARHLEALCAAGTGDFAVVVLDIDHFKAINDRHGHLQGDAVLRQFASLLRQHTRREDMAARWGGEEFVLVIRQAQATVLVTLLERLLGAVRATRLSHDEDELRYTVSAGLAQALPGMSASDLLAQADRALYQAKRQGRDRYVLAPTADASAPLDSKFS